MPQYTVGIGHLKQRNMHIYTALITVTTTASASVE